MLRNHGPKEWPTSPGIGGPHRPEPVAHMVRNTHRYNHCPPTMRIAVMSVTHFVFGRTALKSRARWFCTPDGRVPDGLLRYFFLHGMPRMPATRMSRATRFSPAVSPSSRRSSKIRGAPSTLSLAACNARMRSVRRRLSWARELSGLLRQP